MIITVSLRYHHRLHQPPSPFMINRCFLPVNIDLTLDRSTSTSPHPLQSISAASLPGQHQGPQHPRSISTIPAHNHLFRRLARPTSISATSPSIDQPHARHSSITVLTSNAPPFHRPPHLLSHRSSALLAPCCVIVDCKLPHWSTAGLTYRATMSLSMPARLPVITCTATLPCQNPYQPPS
jgi:hypothetical protein